MKSIKLLILTILIFTSYNSYTSNIVLSNNDISELKRLVKENNDRNALYILGMSYYTGSNNMLLDHYKAFKRIKKSAQLGNPDAQFQLAKMYYAGHGIKKNINSAKKWFTKVSKIGNNQATKILERIAISELPPTFAWMNDKTNLTNKGWYQLIKSSAEYYNTESQKQLAKMHYSGYGAKKDIKKAKKLLQEASDLGDKNAKIILTKINADKIYDEYEWMDKDTRDYDDSWSKSSWLTQQLAIIAAKEKKLSDKKYLEEFNRDLAEKAKLIIRPRKVVKVKEFKGINLKDSAVYKYIDKITADKPSKKASKRGVLYKWNLIKSKKDTDTRKETGKEDKYLINILRNKKETDKKEPKRYLIDFLNPKDKSKPEVDKKSEIKKAPKRDLKDLFKPEVKKKAVKKEFDLLDLFKTPSKDKYKPEVYKKPEVKKKAVKKEFDLLDLFKTPSKDKYKPEVYKKPEVKKKAVKKEFDLLDLFKTPSKDKYKPEVYKKPDVKKESAKEKPNRYLIDLFKTPSKDKSKPEVDKKPEVKKESAKEKPNRYLIDFLNPSKDKSKPEVDKKPEVKKEVEENPKAKRGILLKIFNKKPEVKKESAKEEPNKYLIDFLTPNKDKSQLRVYKKPEVKREPAKEKPNRYLIDFFK